VVPADLRDNLPAFRYKKPFVAALASAGSTQGRSGAIAANRSSSSVFPSGGIPMPIRIANHRFVVGVFVLLIGLPAVTIGPSDAALPDETKQQKDERMEWWREAKFGMFIHWGLYAIPAGEWKGKTVPGIGEWIMHRGKIPKEEYAVLQKQFNPVKYDPEQWVRAAKEAGMKYIVITSKHHDGFCLFDSQLTDYDIMGTPYGRDLLKPLADASHKAGMKICWYHSIMDWYHPEAHNEKYIEHMKGQLKELLENYGDIGVLWFDGEWIREWDEAKGIELEKYIRAMQPKLIVNNRVGKRKKRSPGDFGTPEQHIPATGMPGWDWETCMTMNGTWGYRKDDHRWKSTEDLIHKLVDIVSKGGNFLLNVGPTADGEIPQPSLERLAEIGEWMQVNGDSIYGTQASPFKRLAWGRCTRKPGRLYLHVFDWPSDGQLRVPGLGNKVQAAYLLADSEKRPLTTTRDDDDLTIEVPDAAPDKIDTVVVVEIQGEPIVTAGDIKQADDRSIALHARDAETHGGTIRYEQGGGKDNIGYWTNPEDWVSWVCRVNTPATFDVYVTYACTQPGGSRYVVEVADQKIEATTESTGSWTAFKSHKIGTVKLSEDRHILSVKAKDLKGEGVMNLRSVELKPTAGE
jgi:alpha-L-fucosidase